MTITKTRLTTRREKVEWLKEFFRTFSDTKLTIDSYSLLLMMKAAKVYSKATAHQDAGSTIKKMALEAQKELEGERASARRKN